MLLMYVLMLLQETDISEYDHAVLRIEQLFPYSFQNLQDRITFWTFFFHTGCKKDPDLTLLLFPLVIYHILDTSILKVGNSFCINDRRIRPYNE
jgi:hypothetical protein